MSATEQCSACAAITEALVFDGDQWINVEHLLETALGLYNPVCPACAVLEQLRDDLVDADG
jgi:hypothetical protein